MADYSTEHLKTGLMILEAYVLIAPERVISVSFNLCARKNKCTNIKYLNHCSYRHIKQY